MARWEDRENRKFLRAGTIAAAALNPHIDRKRHPQPLTAYDFFHIPPPPKPKPTKKQLIVNADRVFGFVNRVHRRNEARRDRLKESA